MTGKIGVKNKIFQKQHIEKNGVKIQVICLVISFQKNDFEWSDEDASEASIRVAFPSEARKSGA